MTAGKFPAAVKLLVLLMEAGEAGTVAVAVCKFEAAVASDNEQVKDVVEMDATDEDEVAEIVFEADVVVAAAKH